METVELLDRLPASSSTVAYLAVDGEGRIAGANPAFARFVGAPEDGVVGRSLASLLVASEDRLEGWLSGDGCGAWTDVFVFISHLTVPDGDHDELERHFRERSRLVDDFPGFLYLQLLKPQAGAATHTFLTAWESRDDFRRYMASREHAVSHGREPREIMARTDVRHEAYEVLMDSRLMDSRLMDSRDDLQRGH